MSRKSWWLHWYRRRQKSGSAGGCSGGTPKRRQHSALHSASRRARGLQRGAGAARQGGGLGRGAASRNESAAARHRHRAPWAARPRQQPRTARRGRWPPGSAGPGPGPGTQPRAPPPPPAAPPSRPPAGGLRLPAGRPGCAQTCRGGGGRAGAHWRPVSVSRATRTHAAPGSKLGARRPAGAPGVHDHGAAVVGAGRRAAGSRRRRHRCRRHRRGPATPAGAALVMLRQGRHGGSAHSPRAGLQHAVCGLSDPRAPPSARHSALCVLLATSPTRLRAHSDADEPRVPVARNGGGTAGAQPQTRCNDHKQMHGTQGARRARGLCSLCALQPPSSWAPAGGGRAGGGAECKGAATHGRPASQLTLHVHQIALLTGVILSPRQASRR